MNILSILLWPLATQMALSAPPSAQAVDSVISQQVAKQFAALGGSPKALKHLGCIFKNQRKTRFGLKAVKEKKNASLVDKCNRVEGGKAEVSIQRDDYALVIDFTRPPTQRRMFLVPINGKGNVEAYFTGHGRFGNTPRDNEKATDKKNAIDTLKLFSNKPNSNATATGLFIAGHRYVGKYDGPKKAVIKKTKKGKKKLVKVRVDPKDTKYSLVLHGVENEVNDNACTRATVIHGSTKISEAGKEEGVHLMSSGCPMVDYKAVNHIVDSLRGGNDAGGAAILAFGPREAKLGDDFYCELRPGQKPSEGDDADSVDHGDEDAQSPEEEEETVNDTPEEEPDATAAPAPVTPVL